VRDYSVLMKLKLVHVEQIRRLEENLFQYREIRH
jgi:hypothetical protein